VQQRLRPQWRPLPLDRDRVPGRHQGQHGHDPTCPSTSTSRLLSLRVRPSFVLRRGTDAPTPDLDEHRCPVVHHACGAPDRSPT
jgi:hypothetical protein